MTNTTTYQLDYQAIQVGGLGGIVGNCAGNCGNLVLLDHAPGGAFVCQRCVWHGEVGSITGRILFDVLGSTLPPYVGAKVCRWCGYTINEHPFGQDPLALSQAGNASSYIALPSKLGRVCPSFTRAVCADCGIGFQPEDQVVRSQAGLTHSQPCTGDDEYNVGVGHASTSRALAATLLEIRDQVAEGYTLFEHHAEQLESDTYYAKAVALLHSATAYLGALCYPWAPPP